MTTTENTKNEIHHVPKYKIPKIVYQTHSDRTLPLIYQKNLEINQNNSPDYKFIVYSENQITNFIRSHYGNRMLRLYKSIRPEYGPARADFWRYLIIYMFGGVYLDIKGAVLAPIENLVNPDDELIYSPWGRGSCNKRFLVNGMEANQWCIMAKPKHPIIKDTILKMINNFKHVNPYIHGKRSILHLTGPCVYSKALNDHKKLLSGQYRVIDYNIFKKTINYSEMKNRFNTSHTQVSKKHYSRLKSPILKKKFRPWFYNKLIQDFNKL